MAGDGGGNDGSAWALLVAVCSLVINLIVAAVAGIWTLVKSGSATDEKIAVKDKTTTDDLSDLERRIKDEISDATQRFGETVTAIREKVRDTELWNRDNFVTKGTFQIVVGDMKKSWERFEDQLNTRLDKIDKKLDRNHNGGG